LEDRTVLLVLILVLSLILPMPIASRSFNLLGLHGLESTCESDCGGVKSSGCESQVSSVVKGCQSGADFGCRSAATGCGFPASGSGSSKTESEGSVPFSLSTKGVNLEVSVQSFHNYVSTPSVNTGFFQVEKLVVRLGSLVQIVGSNTCSGQECACPDGCATQPCGGTKELSCGCSHQDGCTCENKTYCNRYTDTHMPCLGYYITKECRVSGCAAPSGCSCPTKDYCTTYGEGPYQPCSGTMTLSCSCSPYGCDCSQGTYCITYSVNTCSGTQELSCSCSHQQGCTCEKKTYCQRFSGTHKPCSGYYVTKPCSCGGSKCPPCPSGDYCVTYAGTHQPCSVPCEGVPEFPLGAALEIALVPVLIYTWRRKTSRKSSKNYACPKKIAMGACNHVSTGG